MINILYSANYISNIALYNVENVIIYYRKLNQCTRIQWQEIISPRGAITRSLDTAFYCATERKRRSISVRQLSARRN